MATKRLLKKMAATNLKQKNLLLPYLKALAEVEVELDEMKAKAGKYFGSHPDDLTEGNLEEMIRVLNLLRQANGKN